MPPPNKKRRITPLPKSKGPQPEEITFNLDARQDYLTGFHRRKVQRTKAAQEAAERRAKDEKRQHRQKLREERKRELEERVRMVDATFKPPIKEVSEGGSDESENDSEDGDDVVVTEAVLEKVDHEAEYVDEDKYTSVVVEEVAVDRDGFVHGDDAVSDDEVEAQTVVEQSKAIKKTGDAGSKGKRKWTIEKPKDAAAKAKKKRKKFRYESKAERKIERGKQRAKNSKQAKARREK
ncbi:Ribosomal RNA-processing protein 17 [Cyphellophora attinorum]|uniref:Ribosomal RNA-processing protein 17 n=1 Tax=Cyphellophora attinorum TaxID=1664694 RepID=A0A0N1P3T6_9EURO|nr:Ribosomal RNA-processing protein 17 [Phialophora attinorum]KPI46002.1 Ribosomal RNA-processing protein 17 [Phialophora attinorum]